MGASLDPDWVLTPSQLSLALHHTITSSHVGKTENFPREKWLCSGLCYHMVYIIHNHLGAYHYALGSVSLVDSCLKIVQPNNRDCIILPNMDMVTFQTKLFIRGCTRCGPHGHHTTVHCLHTHKVTQPHAVRGLVETDTSLVVITKESWAFYHSIGSPIDGAHPGPKTDRDNLGRYCP